MSHAHAHAHAHLPIPFHHPGKTAQPRYCHYHYMNVCMNNARVIIVFGDRQGRLRDSGTFVLFTESNCKSCFNFAQQR